MIPQISLLCFNFLCRYICKAQVLVLKIQIPRKKERELDLSSYYNPGGPNNLMFYPCTLHSSPLARIFRTASFGVHLKQQGRLFIYLVFLSVHFKESFNC